ncbi:MAG TPA: DegT/DnrJ/EryC1/StrS family aminotransferase [Myxococcota bacterium]|jgi:dTDP-4-amino-4,6-dideoxygalactose transaminase
MTPLRRLPPGGSPATTAELRAVLREEANPEALRAALRARLRGVRVQLYRSGREALRAALAAIAARSGRREVIVPAYTCFSVPSAVVAAGLRVRLIDLTASGAVDPAWLERLPLERAAALVVGNLFGVAEPVALLRAKLRAAGVALIDDAAQSLGAQSEGAPAGCRGDVGVLSFGRGKPLEALGGGALLWPETAAPLSAEPPAEAPARLAALLALLGYSLASSSLVFRWLAAMPALGIGTTRFETGFARGGIRGRELAIAAARVAGLRAREELRIAEASRLAQELREGTSLLPLLAPAGDRGVYPRLAALAPDADSREAALAALDDLGAGASRMYPTPLDLAPGLAPYLEPGPACTGARDFCARLLTLPTHGRWSPRQRSAVLSALRSVAPGPRGSPEPPARLAAPLEVRGR